MTTDILPFDGPPEDDVLLQHALKVLSMSVLYANQLDDVAKHIESIGTRNPESHRMRKPLDFVQRNDFASHFAYLQANVKALGGTIEAMGKIREEPEDGNSGTTKVVDGESGLHRVDSSNGDPSV